MKAIVQSVRQEAPRIKSFVLAAADESTLPSFTPGAHVVVELGADLRRPYSLCSDAADCSRYRLAVLLERDGRGGSRAMHALRAGAVLALSEPVNRFPLATEARHHLLIAGGIGITPFLPMVRALRRGGDSFDLHYCARTPAQAAFVAELRDACPLGALHLHFDEGDPSRGLDVAGLLSQPRPGTHVYCCGPPGLMNAVCAAGAAWPEGSLHFEAFAAKPVAGDADQPFRIRVKGHDQAVEVAADETALAALRRAGFSIASDCESGVCGACITRYIRGTPIHRDQALMTGERGCFFTPCVSRAEGDLEVELA